MADVTATAHVFPSANDLEGGQPNGWGETLYEKNLSTFWLAMLGSNNFTFSGALLPASDADLTMTIPTGKFWLDGHFIEIAATAITFPASNTSSVFAKLLKDVNGNVSSVAYEHNTSGTPPADATPIGTVTTSGSAVTSTVDLRLLGPHGVIVLTSGTSWPVPAGINRVFVQVFGASGGGGGGSEGASALGSGGNGTAGGTTSFGALSAAGGSGGDGGLVGQNRLSVATTYHANSGNGSGGKINLRGGGQDGGIGGNGGDAAAFAGKPGGTGGYTADYVAVTPGSAVTYAIGGAGGGGGGGTGGGGPDGAAGTAGQPGLIAIHY